MRKMKKEKIEGENTEAENAIMEKIQERRKSNGEDTHSFEY